MPASPGTSSSTISISRQSSHSIATTTPKSTVRPTSISNSTCVYSCLTASVSLVMRLTSWPVMARSKNAIGSRSTWPYTLSRSRRTERVASPARRTSWK